MVNGTLTLWGNGAVTLPKEWREKYDTKHFLAREDAQGYLVIMPIVDVQYYEQTDGTCGLKFPSGIEAGELLHLFEQATASLSAEEKKGKRKPSRKKH